MPSSAEKARAQRLDRLRTALATRVDNPAAALEALLSELRAGEERPELWEALHAAAVRDQAEAALASAYTMVTTERRLQALPPEVQARVLMHASDFLLGVVGDVDAAENVLVRVLGIVPGHAEAYSRLERRYLAAHDNRKLVELCAAVAAAPPRPVDELVGMVVNALVPLPASAPVSDDACRGLVALAPVRPGMLDVLEAHCRKTERIALACELLETAIDIPELPSASVLDLRRRLLELYQELGTPQSSIAHVEALLLLGPADERARAAAERLLGNRDVSSRAAAALAQARQRARTTR